MALKVECRGLGQAGQTRGSWSRNSVTGDSCAALWPLANQGSRRPSLSQTRARGAPASRKPGLAAALAGSRPPAATCPADTLGPYRKLLFIRAGRWENMAQHRSRNCAPTSLTLRGDSGWIRVPPGTLFHAGAGPPGLIRGCAIRAPKPPYARGTGAPSRPPPARRATAPHKTPSASPSSPRSAPCPPRCGPCP
jgi:hypothetical protein